MTLKYTKIFINLALVSLVASPLPVLAHEAYVLDNNYYWDQLRQPISSHGFAALRDAHNLMIFLQITAGVALLLALNFFLRLTTIGRRLHAWPERFARFGPLFIRFALAGALFFSAASNSFLGPEITLDNFTAPTVMQTLLFLTSAMIALGLCTEIAAAIALGLFATATKIFGNYMLTYSSYLGALFALLLFGMRRWSIDAIFWGKLGRQRTLWSKYENTLVRIFYGCALIYAAITVKFLHPEIMIHVATTWNLAQFHWLFPADPALIALGAGLAEVAIGLMIILGFEMRLAVIISLFYLTASLFFFREMVWPHLILYGISLSLLVQPDTFTLDHLLLKKFKRKLPQLRPVISPRQTPDRKQINEK